MFIIVAVFSWFSKSGSHISKVTSDNRNVQKLVFRIC